VESRPDSAALNRGTIRIQPAAHHGVNPKLLFLLCAANGITHSDVWSPLHAQGVDWKYKLEKHHHLIPVRQTKADEWLYG